jgi:hypothetical protein
MGVRATELRRASHIAGTATDVERTNSRAHPRRVEEGWRNMLADGGEERVVGTNAALPTSALELSPIRFSAHASIVARS